MSGRPAAQALRLDPRVAVAVALGGALGALARQGLTVEWPADGRSWPWATFAANLIGTAILGLLLAWRGDWWASGWFQAKIVLVLLLTGVHHLYGRWRKAFEADRNTRPASYYRWWNEVPTVLMIAIVFLVVLKPF